MTQPTIETNGHAQETKARHILELRLARIKESPTNPRKRFGDLDELAGNIKQHGVLQPVLVRPKGEDYELVFGARRYRASKLAKLTTIPVECRELGDEEVLELQLIENGKREDMHPLEEAEGYEQLHTRFHMSVDDIAAKVGKTRSTVYARMKLCELIPEARKAFDTDDISLSVALSLARVPAALQKQALKELTAKNYQGETPSARESQRIVAEHYMLKLADAPFDRGDTALVPEAGSCKDCPKRTGNQRELFADIASPDVCTDPTCYAKKKTAHVAREKERLEAKGVRIMKTKASADSSYIPSPEGYERLDGKHWTGKGETTLGALAKKAGVEHDRAVMFDGRGKTVDLIPVALARKLRGMSEDRPDPQTGRTKAQNREAKWRNEATRRTLSKIATAAEQKKLDAAALRLCILALCQHSFHDALKGVCAARNITLKKNETPSQAIIKLLPSTKEWVLRSLLVHILAHVGAPGPWSSTPQHAFAAACKLYRVNYAAELATVKHEAKKKAPARGKKAK